MRSGRWKLLNHQKIIWIIITKATIVLTETMAIMEVKMGTIMVVTVAKTETKPKIKLNSKTLMARVFLRRN
jgi:hypothetical protein